MADVLCCQLDDRHEYDLIKEINSWAGPTRSTQGFTANFYMGNFAPSDDASHNVLALVSGDSHHFTAVHRQLHERFAPKTEFDDQRSLGQSMVDAVFAGLRSEQLDTFINAATSVLTTGTRVRTLFAGPPLVARTFLDRSKRELVLSHLCRLLEEGKHRGADSAVLGAYTKIDGLDAELARLNILPVATGNRFTAHIQAQHILRVCQMHNWNPAETPVAIVGACGSVGRGLAMALRTHCPLILVGRTESHLCALADSLAGRGSQPIAIAYGPSALTNVLPRARIVIFLTKGFRFEHDVIPPNVYFVDAARPHATRNRLRQLLGPTWRNWLDDGGLVDIRGVHLEPDLFHLPRQVMLPCLSERLALIALRFFGHFGIEPEVFPWLTDIDDYMDRLESELMFVARGAQLAGIGLSEFRAYHNTHSPYELI